MPGVFPAVVIQDAITLVMKQAPQFDFRHFC